MEWEGYLPIPRTQIEGISFGSPQQRNEIVVRNKLYYFMGCRREEPNRLQYKG